VQFKKKKSTQREKDDTGKSEGSREMESSQTARENNKRISKGEVWTQSLGEKKIKPGEKKKKLSGKKHCGMKPKTGGSVHSPGSVLPKKKKRWGGRYLFVEEKGLIEKRFEMRGVRQVLNRVNLKRGIGQRSKMDMKSRKKRREPNNREGRKRKFFKCSKVVLDLTRVV